MSEEYQAQPITWADAPAAYPLVYLHDASVTLEAWLAFVRRRTVPASGRNGLIVIRDRRNIIHALFTYRVDPDLRGRKRLCIAQLIVAHLPGSQIDRAVIASTDEVATALGCQTVFIEQPFQLGPGAPALYPGAGRPRDGVSRQH